MFFKTFYEKQELILSKESQAKHLLKTFEMQIEHFKEYEFNMPLNTAEQELVEARNELKQFEKIVLDHSGNFLEKRERRAMVLGYEQIIDEISKKFNDHIKELCDSWNTQFRELNGYDADEYLLDVINN